MAIEKVVRPQNLGAEFDIGVEESGKIHVKIDGVTLVRDPSTGKISVDTSAIDQTIVSQDVGQVLTAGTDGGALITKETFEDIVGAMVLGATDGLTYDDAIGALTSAVASTVGTDTDGVDVTSTLADGVLNIKVDIVLDPSADNVLVKGANGLMLDGKALLESGDNAHAVVSGDKFTTTVNGKSADTNIVELQDAFGVHLGEILA